MPSTYAHYRLGRDVLPVLPRDLRDIADGNRELYDIGLHGPDLLFYYDALHRNPVNSIGYGMHSRPGREFFLPARRRLDSVGDRDAGMAYLFGFVCHFALDSTCHPYIERRIHESGIAHTKIEGEYDRMLLVRDGEDPVSRDLSVHIVPSDRNAGIIHPFLPPVTSEQILKSLKDMRTYNSLLVCPGRLKRRMVLGRLRRTGHLEDMGGLILNAEGDPACEESNTVLDFLYADAVKLSAELIGNLRAFMDGDEPLSPRFDRTFSWM